MRELAYLSPTSIACFLKSPEDFYLDYLCESRPPRQPQTQPMSIGSAFDAFVKSYLHEGLFGKDNDPRFQLSALFEAQVEPHNRDWAMRHGHHAFKVYKASGALADLMFELQSSIGAPKFEFEVRGVIAGQREGISKEFGCVTFLGKPDVFFINKEGHHVILDFKVNGWCSKRSVSPVPGYIRMRGNMGDFKFVNKSHPDCKLLRYNGMNINGNKHFEHYEENWSRQLAIYSWLCGTCVGEENVIAIDQLICQPSGFEFPYVRIAEHRSRISADFQMQVYSIAHDIWCRYHSKHFFKDLSIYDSRMKCQYLEDQAKALCGEVNDGEQWFAEQMRKNTQRAY